MCPCAFEGMRWFDMMLTSIVFGAILFCIMGTTLPIIFCPLLVRFGSRAEQVDGVKKFVATVKGEKLRHSQKKQQFAEADRH